MDRRVTSPIWVPPSPCKQALTPPFFINLRYICKEHFFFVQWNKKRQSEFNEQITSNPAFTKNNVQKANANANGSKVSFKNGQSEEQQTLTSFKVVKSTFIEQA